MVLTLQELKQQAASKAFGVPRDEVDQRKASGICLACGEDALPKCYSDAGKREFQISGLCEICFDEITKMEG